MRITRGSGNVFADLRFPDAAERQAKLRLAYALNQFLVRRRLSPAAISRLLRVTESKVSALRHYKLAGFSVERGRAFFQSTHGNEWSCASCHTQDPAASGRHAKTSKAIAPLAPAANPERFTSTAEAEKWFKRNCNDVLGRACTAQEKGDVLAYLMQVTPGGGR